MRTFEAAVASQHRYELAEGPIWDGPRDRVLWVDINAGHVYTGSLSGGVVTAVSALAFDETVGAVVCAADGTLLVAGRRGVYTVDADHRRIPGAQCVPEAKNSRLNDGACDPSGRFLVGSMALDQRTREECLYLLQPGAAPVIIDSDLTLSNGLAWSPDGCVLYSVDTEAMVVWSRRYETSGPTWGERREAIRLTDGFPDGMCIDTNGNLWVAIWGAGQVRCYAPTGDWLATVTVPAPNTSSAAFVGPHLDTLLITTATEDLSAAQLTKYPLSGHLFTANVEAVGAPTTPWRQARWT